MAYSTRNPQSVLTWAKEISSRNKILLSFKNPSEHYYIKEASHNNLKPNDPNAITLSTQSYTNLDSISWLHPSWFNPLQFQFQLQRLIHSLLLLFPLSALSIVNFTLLILQLSERLGSVLLATLLSQTPTGTSFSTSKQEPHYFVTVESYLMQLEILLSLFDKRFEILDFIIWLNYIKPPQGFREISLKVKLKYLNSNTWLH